MAEIIYSAASCVASGEPVSMDVSSDFIEFFVDKYFSIGKTQFGIWFHSAEGYI